MAHSLENFLLLPVHLTCFASLYTLYVRGKFCWNCFCICGANGRFSNNCLFLLFSRSFFLFFWRMDGFIRWGSSWLSSRVASSSKANLICLNCFFTREKNKQTKKTVFICLFLKWGQLFSDCKIIWQPSTKTKSAATSDTCITGQWQQYAGQRGFVLMTAGLFTCLATTATHH